MNLKDMIEKLEEIQATDINEADPISGDMNKMVQDIDDAKARDQVPSSQLTKVTKDLTGKSAQTVDQQIDRLRNSQVPAIRDIIKKADMFDDLLNGPLKSQIAGEIQKMQKSPGQDPDSDYRADRMDNVDMEIDDSIDYDLLDLQDINEGLNKECQDMYNKLMKTDPEKANKFKAMCMKLGPDCTVDQAMTAMDNMKEASPSAQATKYAKDSGQSAQQLDRGVTQIGKRQDVASQGASKLASDMQRLLNSPYANQILRFLQALDKEEPQQLAADMQYENIEEALQNPEVISVLKEFTADVSLPILQQLVGGDKVLAQNARIALRNIDQDKGINKRFMPAVRKLLSKLTDMLSTGGMGALAQFDQLHNQHSSEQPGVGSGAVADPDAVQDPSEYEPSEEEIAQFAVDNGMPITTDVQKKIVADMLKQKMMDKEQDKETSDEPGERPKDNTGRPLNVQDESLDELKKLAGLNEVTKGMPSKSHVMDMCKKGMSNAEMFKMHPEADKDKLKALIDDCKEEMKESVSEAMSDIYGQPKELEGGVEFKQHKGNDKGQVSIEASAESMDDLHELLKLAGVEMSVDLGKAEKPEDSDDNDHDEPESHDNKEEPKDKKVMVISPNDASYSTDKEVLVNFLKDKLKKSIS